MLVASQMKEDKRGVKKEKIKEGTTIKITLRPTFLSS